MDTNRSFLENLNAGRKRRSGTALDHISQTLQEIERQLDRAYAARTAQRPEETGNENPTSKPAAVIARHEDDDHADKDHRNLRELASRLREGGAEESAAPAATVRPERPDAQARPARSPSESDVAYELERLSAEVAALGERRDERTLNLLRLDMEELRASMDALAREETVRLVGRRWEELAAGQGQLGEESVAPIATRIEEIATAVQQLPDGQALRSLEQKVRGLAGALDQFIEHSSQSRPDLHELIEDRLDEISRAIAATAATKAPQVDMQPFERVEARIASLSRQVEEIVEETQSAQLVERLDALAHRVEEMGERIDLPAEAIREMAAQIASISQKVDEALGASEPEAIYHEIERRFAGLSDMMVKSHGEVLEQGERLFGELRTQMMELSRRIDGQAAPEVDHEALMAAFESRFEALSAKLDAHTAAPLADEQMMAVIEERLDGLAERLKESVEHAASLDPQIVQQLQEQIGALADHLAHSGEASADFEDLGPRLTRIERSLAENHESVLDAARRAAEEALASLRQGAAASGEGIDLSAEIRSLEELARRSDDRNARTFEAIHDTLIKIVERLSTMEAEAGSDHAGDALKLEVGAPPSLDPVDEDAAAEIAEIETGGLPRATYEEHAAAHGDSTSQRRTPAEAAAAAAVAAMSGAGEQETNVQPEKRSMLGGLTRAFSPRREREPAVAARKEPAVEDELETAVAESSLDDELANEPLEPGSGAPDLNAIMRRVRDEGGQGARHSDGDAAKADFIAAARRAAQAAAAEAETLKRKKSGEARGSQGRFSGLLRSRKKTALMAVAAIAVAAGGVGAAKMMDANSHRPAKIAAATAPHVKASPAKPAAAASGVAKDAVTTAALPAVAATAAADAKIDAARKVEAKDASPAASDAAPAAPVVEASAKLPVAASPKEAEQPAAAAARSKTEAAAPAADTDDVASAAATDAAPQAAPQATDAEPQTASLEALPTTIGTTALRQAAADGDARALFAVAERYAHGNGVETDQAMAARYYTQAAEKGLAPAQYRIGNDYEKGIGVERDIAKAKDWYAKAADQGNASAMHNLGVLYAMGADGAANNEKAVTWFTRAAEFGVKDSQFNLGILAAKGVGMERDLTEAYKWFAIVAETGDADAASKRDEVAKALDAEALKSAKARAELWKPKPLDRAANVVDLPPEWTPDKTTTASVDMKKAVTNIQLILNKNGYSAGPADGVMGDKTKSAIVAFQKDNGLDATGEVDTKLVQALLAHND